MTTPGKLGLVIQKIYTTVEALTPTYEATRTFQRYRMLEPLELADPNMSFRNFRVQVPSTGPGDIQAQSTQRCKAAAVQVAVSYPLAYFAARAEDADFLGVEVYREDDGAKIVNALAHARPLALQDGTISNVRSIAWRGSRLVGRLWVMSFDVQYMEVL